MPLELDISGVVGVGENDAESAEPNVGVPDGEADGEKLSLELVIARPESEDD